MPATEQTRYPIKRLHRIFAVSSVALLLATIWMFVEDHRRQWKQFQRTANKIEARTTSWKKYRFETDEAVQERQRLQEELKTASLQSIDLALVDQFRAEVAAEYLRLAAGADFGEFDQRRTRLEAVQQAFPADEEPSDEAAESMRTARTAMLESMREFIDRAAFRETRQFTLRKSINGDLDVAKAGVGVAMRSGRTRDELDDLQSSVDRLERQLLTVSAEYDARRDHRMRLDEILAQLTEAERELGKTLAANRAGLERLENALVEQRSTWLQYDYGFPLPGKRVLELPIFDAFNSPLEIHNLWAEGLTQDYHFDEVLRFDRCTTCHWLIQSNSEVSVAVPEFPNEQVLQFVLSLPERPEDVPPEAEPAGTLDESQFEAAFGLRFAEEGLLGPDDVTIMYVRPQSPAAGARPATQPVPPQSDIQIYHSLLWPTDTLTAMMRPGLQMGDVLVAIEGEAVAGRWAAMNRLLSAAKDKGDEGTGDSVVLTLRRGLPNPYLSHPRLDLFVGELSPHKVSEFACTVCHGGQGSATDFKWASHSPDSDAARKHWRAKYDWSDNPHWDDPMFPHRFAESACLKCHHRVVDLLPSQQFSDPPAPKLMRGYRLIQAFGCYGCHEIRGNEEGRSIGPDLRLEPPHLATDLSPAGLQPTTAESNRAGGPGTFRRPSPSLRYVGHKLDAPFMVDWLKDPRRFQPSTKMPRAFGVWNHLDGDSLKIAQDYEPVEIAGIVAYLQARTENVTALSPPADIAESGLAERIQRGRERFQTSGCLACHDHKEFPDATQARNADDLLTAPDLSAIGDKLGNDKGRRWLYTFLREPTRYYPRTIMPNLYLDPETHAGEEGEETMTADPAGDIVEFLLASSSSGYVPPALPELSGDVLNQLVAEYLSDVFHGDRCDEYLQRGIPSRLGATLAVAERELLIADEEHDDPGYQLSAEQKLRYVGFKSTAKYGCFGCHDIAGFESAKPIGTALADWGRIDPSRLAFENIVQYLDGRGANGAGNDPDEITRAGSDDAEDELSRQAYYLRQIRSGSRIGFGYQKLTEPRSYDYRVADNKRYKDRLRMPQFSLNAEDREAVLTFVLGLVAQPPADKYVYTPDRKRASIIQGQAILEKYRCARCHILESEQWRIGFPPDTFDPQQGTPSYPFVARPFSADQLERSLQIDRRGLLNATVSGMPSLDVGGRPMAFDDYGDELFDDESYDPWTLEYAFQLWEPAAIDGHGYQVGESAVSIWGDQIEGKRPGDGGYLAKYLLPYVIQMEKKANPNAVGSQAWGWLPPPLVGEGRKVQPEWLYSYLLEPYPIRPASMMRMPKFTLSSDEARALVDYFAVRDGMDYPYAFLDRRSRSYLQEAEQTYQQRLAAAGDNDSSADRTRFGDAMHIVADKNFCVTCHIVGRYDPVTSMRAKGPDLAEVYRRLRPEYLRRWIAKPTSVLPYTAMQVVIPYDADRQNLGGVDQALYHGTSVQQLDAVVDLLSNLDVYARSRGTLVPQAEPTDDATGVEPAPTDSD